MHDWTAAEFREAAQCGGGDQLVAPTHWNHVREAGQKARTTTGPVRWGTTGGIRTLVEELAAGVEIRAAEVTSVRRTDEGDLLVNEPPPAGESFQIKWTALMFTDLGGSTALYARKGDPRAGAR